MLLNGVEMNSVFIYYKIKIEMIIARTKGSPVIPNYEIERNNVRMRIGATGIIGIVALASSRQNMAGIWHLPAEPV